MRPASPAGPPGIETHRAFAVFVLVFSAAMIAWSAAFFGGLIDPVSNAVVDFHAYYIAGQLAWEGALADAYGIETMAAAQARLSGTEGIMPWTYPPQFNLLTAGLALLPQGLAYLVFTGGSFAVYVLVLRRLAGVYTGAVLLAVAPALFINILIGQNGFLTGALAGLFCLAALGQRASSGVALGLMVIKPHLAVGLAVLAVASRLWRALLFAAVTALATALMATLAFGPAIWPAFLGGASEAGGFLQSGVYPFYRMTSVFALLLSLGVAPGTAFAAQAAVALAAAAAIAAAALARMPPRRLLGLAAYATLLISPYNYDYDLTILGIALALLIPEASARTRGAEKAGLLVLTWFACGWGLACVYAFGAGAATGAAATVDAQVSLAAFGYLGLGAWLALVLSRP